MDAVLADRPVERMRDRSERCQEGDAACQSQCSCLSGPICSVIRGQSAYLHCKLGSSDLLIGLKRWSSSALSISYFDI